MSTTYTTDPTSMRDTRLHSTGHARFSGLDIAGFLVAAIMLLAPLAMAARSTWMLPVGF
jgi:hypothetical protein